MRYIYIPDYFSQVFIVFKVLANCHSIVINVFFFASNNQYRLWKTKLLKSLSQVLLVDLKQNIIKEKKIIHVCGASTKGNIILQYSKIDKKDISYAADRNPLKWNRKMPGSNIPIVSESNSRSKKPDFYLVLPWHFKKEFIQREKKFLSDGGRLIFPLPKVQIISNKNLYSS